MPWKLILATLPSHYVTLRAAYPAPLNPSQLGGSFVHHAQKDAIMAQYSGYYQQQPQQPGGAFLQPQATGYQQQQPQMTGYSSGMGMGMQPQMTGYGGGAGGMGMGMGMQPQMTGYGGGGGTGTMGYGQQQQPLGGGYGGGQQQYY
jgi:hypothetical protein